MIKTLSLSSETMSRAAFVVKVDAHDAIGSLSRSKDELHGCPVSEYGKGLEEFFCSGFKVTAFSTAPG